MALGGGTFLTQNKVLPGSYINFVSLARASATLADRGVAAMPLMLDWGVDGEVFKVESEDFQKDTTVLFGYDYTHEKIKGLRDLFKNIKTAYFYRLNSGEKAFNTYATAKHSGTRGNDITIVISANVDNLDAFDVTTLLGTTEKDMQTVTAASELVSNEWVDFKADAVLEATAGTPLSGGSNKAEVEGIDHQNFLDKVEPYSFNGLGCPSTTEEVKDLYIQFTKRLRDEVGAKFQTVVYQKTSDYEGVVSVENPVLDEDETEASLVFWTTGAIAGCPVNKSNQNKLYDGEFTVHTDYKQSELKAGLKEGKFMFHVVDDDVRVLDDINTFTTFTVEKNEDFSSNQTIRVLDQIANDIARIFNTQFLGEVPNDGAGRISFWNTVTKHHQQLQKIRAIEGFVADDITVAKGETKKSVVVTDTVEPTNAMGQLYMSVIVA